MGEELEHCGNCGRLLYLPESERVGEHDVRAKTTKSAKQMTEPLGHVR